MVVFFFTVTDIISGQKNVIVSDAGVKPQHLFAADEVWEDQEEGGREESMCGQSELMTKSISVVQICISKTMRCDIKPDFLM